MHIHWADTPHPGHRLLARVPGQGTTDPDAVTCPACLAALGEAAERLLCPHLETRLAVCVVCGHDLAAGAPAHARIARWRR